MNPVGEGEDHKGDDPATDDDDEDEDEDQIMISATDDDDEMNVKMRMRTRTKMSIIMSLAILLLLLLLLLLMLMMMVMMTAHVGLFVLLYYPHDVTYLFMVNFNRRSLTHAIVVSSIGTQCCAETIDRYLELMVTFVVEALFLDTTLTTSFVTTLAHALVANIITLPLK